MGAVSPLPARATHDSGYREFFWWVFEQSRIPMWMRDLERVLVAVNPAALAFSGYQANDLLGRRSDLLVPPREWKRLDPEWRALLHRGEATGDYEIRMASGRIARAQLASRVTGIDGQQRVLTVAIELHLVPRARGAKRSARDGRPLTPRELEIIHKVALGRRAHEIADELVIAPSTVETHIRNAMAKVGARSQAQLVTIALCHGLLDRELLQHELDG